MTFSARSLALKAVPVGAVPLIGRDSTTAPSRRRKSSGDADASSTPGRRTTAPNGAGFPDRNRPPRATMSAAGETGADSTRHRLTSYTSPAAMASRMATTPFPNASVSRLDVHSPEPGPTHEGQASGMGPAPSNRAQTTSPSNVTATTQAPVESRADRSDVTSRSPVKQRPPTTATGSRSPTCVSIAP